MTGNSSQTSSTVIIPLLGSLLLNGIAVSMLCQPPARPSLYWSQLVAIALLYVMIAAIVHAAAVWTLCKVFHEHIQLSSRLLILGLWMSVAWLPLLALLIREHSIWMVCLPPLISAYAFIFLKREYVRTGKLVPSAFKSNELSSLFYIPEPPSLLRTVLPAAATSIAFQAGLAALLLGHYLAAGSLFLVCPLLPIWLFPVKPPSSGADDTEPRVSIRSSLIDTAIVIVFTAIALIPFLRKGSFAADLGALLKASLASPTSAPPRTHAEHGASDYTGVILFVPAKPAEKIMTAPPATHTRFGSALAKPVVIPFDGPYWYFKQPDHRPRHDAPVIHGDPTKANVRSTDFLPLSMEAHQFLATPISMDCCSAIRVALQNADNRPGAIAAEVLLKDASAILGSESSTQSLGTVVIPSSTIKPIALNRPPVNEVLNFPLPAGVRGRQFSEITVVIKPARERAQAGAHVAIQHFVLMP